MAEEKRVSMGELWNHALRVVKGERTAELVECFTHEMTLVAEGLCEDQARIRRSVDDMTHQMKTQESRIQQDMQRFSMQIGELAEQIAVLEKSVEKLRNHRFWRGFPRGNGFMRLISVASAAALILSVLRFFV